MTYSSSFDGKYWQPSRRDRIANQLGLLADPRYFFARCLFFIAFLFKRRAEINETTTYALEWPTMITPNKMSPEQSVFDIRSTKAGPIFVSSLSICVTCPQKKTTEFPVCLFVVNIFFYCRIVFQQSIQCDTWIIYYRDNVYCTSVSYLLRNKIVIAYWMSRDQFLREHHEITLLYNRNLFCWIYECICMLLLKDCSVWNL